MTPILGENALFNQHDKLQLHFPRHKTRVQICALLIKIYFLDCLVTLANFICGAILGWLAPTLKTYRNSESEFAFTDDDCSWIVALQYAGRLFGCLFAAATIDRYGRVKIISLSVILITISSSATVFSKVVILHYILRFSFGTSLGAINITTTIYSGENSSPKVRGIFGSSCLMLRYGGQVVGCALATYCSYILAAGILAGISLVSLASTVLLREPAQHLLATGDETKAEQQFIWLRGNDETAKKEFHEIKDKQKVAETKFSFDHLLDRRILIVCAVASLIIMTGYAPIFSMVSIALASTDTVSANELAILFQAVQFIGAIGSLFIIDRYNRRTLWMTACPLAIVFHLMTATLYYLQEKHVDVPAYSWLLFGSITAYTTVFSTFLNSLSSTTRGEFLPQKYKGAGSCAAVLLSSAIASVQGFAFLKIASVFGMKMNFITFAISSFALSVFCYFLLPKTRGMSLVEIEKYFDGLKKTKEIDDSAKM
ncbi:hypothetical protein V9T40_003273 [Parthenolecanium corni]|uniref:Major facilitator superfamily (MFS) profile domain-containing protein n=1 Tax=Parthenolecanium corni TaxID=536013 RepID=A0AAN9Y9I8_9HEMI